MPMLQAESASAHAATMVRHPAIRNFDPMECIPKSRRRLNCSASRYTSADGRA
jgi:hypothetical protein